MTPLLSEVSMETQPTTHPQQEPIESDVETEAAQRTFVEPRLTFIPPTLVKHGPVVAHTQQTSPGFFGTFSP
jgi:hypothetical protein